MTSNEAFAYNKIWVSYLSEASLFSHCTKSLLELIMNDITSPSDCLFRRATHEYHVVQRTSYPKMIVANSLTNCLGFLWPVSRAPRSQGIALKFRTDPSSWRISAHLALSAVTARLVRGLQGLMVSPKLIGGSFFLDARAPNV